jgi:hypothetical protein
MHRVPAIPIQDCNGAPVRAYRYVLYWMIAARRLTFNFALDRALEYCRELGKPLVILEGLRCGYRWASDRRHRFVIEGMADHAVACERAGVRYFPYAEPTPGGGKWFARGVGARSRRCGCRRLPVFLSTADGRGGGGEHEIFREAVQREEWEIEKLSVRTDGRRN